MICSQNPPSRHREASTATPGSACKRRERLLSAQDFPGILIRHKRPTLQAGGPTKKDVSSSAAAPNCFTATLTPTQNLTYFTSGISPEHGAPRTAQVQYTIGGAAALRVARQYYAAAVHLSDGASPRALLGITAATAALSSLGGQKVRGVLPLAGTCVQTHALVDGLSFACFSLSVSLYMSVWLRLLCPPGTTSQSPPGDVPHTLTAGRGCSSVRASEPAAAAVRVSP